MSILSGLQVTLQRQAAIACTMATVTTTVCICHRTRRWKRIVQANWWLFWIPVYISDACSAANMWSCSLILTASASALHYHSATSSSSNQAGLGIVSRDHRPPKTNSRSRAKEYRWLRGYLYSLVGLCECQLTGRHVWRKVTYFVSNMSSVRARRKNVLNGEHHHHHHHRNHHSNQVVVATHVAALHLTLGLCEKQTSKM